jgi:hypothetical protein
VAAVTVSKAHKQIARTVATGLGGQARVVQYLDAAEESAIALVISRDRPYEGVTSYGTVGLSDWQVPGRLTPPLGVEIIAACDSTKDWFANVVSTAAFCVINSGWTCQPGAVFPDVVAMYRRGATLPHLLFVEPFLWDDDTFEPRRIGERTVAWLLTVPISQAERDFAAEHGADALEDRFEHAQIDIFDLDRQPVV